MASPKKKKKEIVHEDRLINCQVEITRQFYPKAPAPLVEGEFGIVVGKVLEWDRSAHEPQLHPVYRTITIKSDRLPDIKVGDGRVYYLKAYECESDYGISYLVQLMTEKVDLTTEAEQRAFLKRIISEKQVDALFRMFDNPIDVIQHGTIEQLMMVEGIGQKKAEKLIEKVLGTQDMSVIFTELDHYGLTQREINQLVAHFKDPRMVVAQMKQNPYVMIDIVDRVGFLRADEVAMNGGFNRKSVFRVKAFLKYYLDQQAEAGNSWVETGLAVQEIQTYFKEENLSYELISKTLRQAAKEFMWHNETKNRIGLQSMYELEKEIAYHLHRLLAPVVKHVYHDWEAKVKEQEERQGWTYTDEQKEAIQCILANNVSLIQGVAGCVDKDTEYFNGTGWKKISTYEAGEKVLQYHEDGTASLVEPIAYIKQPQDTLYHIKTKYGMDQCLSLEHEMVYETARGNLKKKPLKAIKQQHEQSLRGFGGKFRTTFTFSEGNGMDLTDEEIRVMVAVIADGNYHSNTNYCQVNLKKQEKKDRLTKLLVEAGIEFQVVERGNGYHLFKFHTPRREKEFGTDWYQCNQHQREIIMDEVLYWDGSTKHRLAYFTTSQASADFIQFVATTCGYRATLRTYDRTGKSYRVNGKEYIRKSVEYVVGLTTRTTVGMGGFKEDGEKVKIQPYPTQDGYEYCFNVPSEMLVLRRNGRIFITGNCGKTSSVSAVLNIFDGNYTVDACALAGKAAVNISDNASSNGMKIKGSTIHRLLKVSPTTGGFEHHEKNPLLTDIIIVDEVGMIGAELFCSLLRAIKTGGKAIFLGDIGQLESIGKGNIFMDMLEAKAIPSVSLNKVHRQAEKSAIVTESLKVRNKQAICKSTDQGVEVRGELQDLVLDLNREKEDVFPKIINYYFEEWEKMESKNPMDLQVITPMKERGLVSVFPINNAIQDRLFGAKLQQPYIVNQGKKNEFKIYVGDKVLNNQNCYETVDVNYNPCPIFNGNLGIVQHIDHQARLMLVDFENIGLVRLGEDQINKLTLGYAITVHKCLTSDTMIYTEAGLQPLEDFNNHPLPLGQKRLVNPPRVWNGWTLETPSHFYNAGKTAVRSFELEDGTRLTMTLDHKVLSLTEQGRIEPKQAHELTEGDLVLVGGRVPIFGNHQLSEEEVQERVKKGMEEGATGGLRHQTNLLNKGSFIRVVLGFLKGYEEELLSSVETLRLRFETIEEAKDLQLLIRKLGVQLSWRVNEAGEVKGWLDENQLTFLYEEVIRLGLNWNLNQSVEGRVSDEFVVRYSGRICRYLCQCFDLHWTKKGDLTRLELMKFIKDFEYKMGHLDLFHYLFLIFNNLTPLPIIKMEEGYENTYCLTMPISKRFVQNGVHGMNCQGSGIHTVIFGTTSSDYVLLNKELIYTALTRCRKKGIVVAESKALRSACTKSSLSSKQTFLTHLLDKEPMD